jgi:hypothetical protein
MQPMQAWKNDLLLEFQRALAARARGNEGQARVCARRAAGVAAREYLSRQGLSAPLSSAMDLFTLLESQPSITDEVRQVISNLRLTVDRDFKLPAHIDLLADARRLCTALLPGWDEP